MRSLTDITVTVEKYDDQKHTEITLDSVVYLASEDEHAADFGYPTTNQLMAAATQVAGVLARVALLAEPWIAYEAQQCRCPQRMVMDEYGSLQHYAADLCAIDGPDSMLRPSADLGDTPALWINVPDKSVDAWLERIREWLEAAITADAVRVEEAAPAPRLRVAREAT